MKNEVKKRGVMFDRNKEKEIIQIRIGDILVVYNSKMIPPELQPNIELHDVSEYNSKHSEPSDPNQPTEDSNEIYQEL